LLKIRSTKIPLAENPLDENLHDWNPHDENLPTKIKYSAGRGPQKVSPREHFTRKTGHARNMQSPYE
jgi:hypothetical protein